MYAYQTIPLHQSSFEPIKLEVDATAGVPDPVSYFPLIVFLCLAFCTSVGVAPIPWMFLSEVFPFKYVFTMHFTHLCKL